MRPLPLKGIVVLDFCQFLSGPSCALRLADLGARVIKIENPKGGDNSRRLIFKNLVYDGDSVLFHTINRNKESFTADLKNAGDFSIVKELIRRADVLLENFRPGVMERLGLGYDTVKEWNPRIVYGSVSGYGKKGAWVKKPGQDLLVQAISGFTWLNGDKDQPPVPFSLSLADSAAGAHLAQGVLACLFRRFKTGQGGLVEISLLESLLDLQFDIFPTFLNNGHQLPERSAVHNAHALLSAPYGIYRTCDGYLALAMGSVPELGEILGIEKLRGCADKAEWFTKRDEIKAIIQENLRARTTSECLEKLTKAGYWCSEVYDWDDLTKSDAFQALDFIIDVKRPGEKPLYTSRCPIRMGGEPIKSGKWAPALGEDNGRILRELGLAPQKGEEKDETA